MRFKCSFLTITFVFNFLLISFAQEPILLEHGGGVRTVEFSPVDASLVASAGESNIIKLWNLQNNTAITLHGHTGRVRSVAFSPNGELLASVSDDRTIKLWNVHNHQNIRTLEDGTSYRSVAFSPDGQMLATGGDRHVKLWDARRWWEIATLQHDQWVGAVAFSHDGQLLAVGEGSGDGPGTVKVWDIQRQQVLVSLDANPKDVKAVEFSSDNRYLAASGWNGHLKIWDVSNWELLGTIPNTGHYDIAFSPDGKTLVSTDRRVVFWSVETGENITSFPAPEGWRHPLDFSADGTNLAVSGDDGLVRIYDNVDSFQETEQEQGMVRLIYFLPRGRPARSDRVAALQQLIQDTQQFFVQEMERHGFGGKTFTFETDGRGKAVVHHVNGRFNDAHYRKETTPKVLEEIDSQFDQSRNIYLIAVDISTEQIDVFCGQGGDRGPRGGHALLPASGPCFNVPLTAHELGHAFGLSHDFRNDAYVMSYGAYRDELSSCHAEWLDAHRCFNTHQIAFNRAASIQMLRPSAVPPNAIRLRFEVTDPEGIHQVQLKIPKILDDFGGIDPQVASCTSLNGENETIEFITTELPLAAVTEGTRHVRLDVMDAVGNFTKQEFPIDITRLLPRRRVVSIRDANLAAAVRKTLGLAPRAPITQLDMLKLTNLEAREQKIKNLIGLEYATNLKYLSLGGNQIRDITPLAELTQLKSVWLFGNQVRGIKPLAGLTNLTDLNLGANLIRDITALTSLTKLRSLWLSDNQIGDITSLAALTDLERLHLANNQISDVRPLVGLTELKHLHLARNPILDTTPLQTLLEQNRDLELDIINVVNPISKITGPWLWMIAPTKAGQGGKNSTNVDSLAKASKGAVTEAKVAKRGAKVGDRIGNYVWTLGEIAASGGNNINDLLNKIGFVNGRNPAITVDDTDIDDHSAYALITLKSAKVQSDVTMRAGSDDAIKVWLNGKVVHNNPINRSADDFRERFTVDLKKGRNLLLVKVSERAGWWSMFVGIEADVETKRRFVAAPLLSASEMIPPTETVLLPNYPNPFNPETWIPYQLSKPAEVKMIIYAVDGNVVRRLALGQQPAGMYHSRSRAAYWDGKNEVGESVASGVYFYTLSAGGFTSTRKMLIWK